MPIAGSLINQFKFTLWNGQAMLPCNSMLLMREMSKVNKKTFKSPIDIKKLPVFPGFSQLLVT